MNNKFFIGVDITNNNRFIDMEEKTIKRILTQKEYIQYMNKLPEYKHLFLAGRWAAKEACYKAINKYINISINNIEILNDENGIPYCTNINNISISISHEKDYTIANAIWTKL